MDYELSTMDCRFPLRPFASNAPLRSPSSLRVSSFSAPLRYLLTFAVLFGAATPASAEYAVLRSGQRIRITGYEQRDANYILHMRGGRLEVPAADVLAIEPEDTFGPAAAPMPRTPYDTLISAAALRHRLDERLISSVIAIESNFDPRAISPRNARGLMQLMPETARRLGVTDIFDPEQNINAGTRYLRELLDRYSGDLTLALAAYNAGPERVTQYRGVPPFPETRAYLSRIAARLRDSSPSGASAPTIAAQ